MVITAPITIKEDYNMEMSPLAWDESSKNAHWRNRRNNQPFFSVLTLISLTNLEFGPITKTMIPAV